MGGTGRHDGHAMRFQCSGGRNQALVFALLAIFLVDCAPHRQVQRPKRKRKPKCKTCPSFSSIEGQDERGLPLPSNQRTGTTTWPYTTTLTP